MTLPITWFNIRILGDIALFSLDFIKKSIEVGKSIRPAITEFANNTGNELYSIAYPANRKQRYVSIVSLTVKVGFVIGSIFAYRKVSSIIHDANKQTNELVKIFFLSLTEKK